MSKICLFTVSIFLCACGNAFAERLIIIGVPSEMDSATSKSVLQATLNIVLDVEEGTRIQVFDAFNLQQVVDMTIPANAGGRNAKARVVRLNSQIAELKQYFTRSSSVRSGRTGQIKLPQFFELSGSGVKATSGDTTILLFGSPYYSDDRDSAFVFGNGYYPSDGHIRASSKESVFGTADKRDLLKSTAVHFCYLGDRFETSLEHAAVRRFWKIYCDNVGAVLSTFGPSPEVTVERCLKMVTDSVSSDTIDPNDAEMEMRKVGVPRDRSVDLPDLAPVDSSTSLNNPNPPAEKPSVHEAVDAALRLVPKPTARSVVIAAAWLAENDPSAADVDLYVQPSDAAVELNFQRTLTAEGRYLRDVREANRSLNNNSWGASWEAVEVEDVQLMEARCWLNLYSGCGGKVVGVVRIAQGDLIADVPFNFPAIAGDAAAGRLARANNPCWIEIPLDQLQWTSVR
jgi:hypothetical protein